MEGVRVTGSCEEVKSNEEGCAEIGNGEILLDHLKRAFSVI